MWWFTYEQVPLPTLSAVVSDGGWGGTEEVDWAASRERTHHQKGRSQVKLLPHLWVQTLPCQRHAGLLPPRLGCVVLCQHMPRCISTDASAPAAAARPLSSRNTHCGLWDRNLCQCHAGCVSQQPRMERAKQTQPWSIPLVFHCFSGHGERSPDPEAAFKHYQIRNESQANSESHLSSRNCLQRQTRTEEFREKQEREREGK